MHVADGLGQKLGGGENGVAPVPKGDGVGEDHLPYGGVGQVLPGPAHQHGVGGQDHDLRQSARQKEGLHPPPDGAPGGDDVVHQKGPLPLHVPDHVGDRGLPGPVAALGQHGEGEAKPFRKPPGLLGPPGVRGDHHGVFRISPLLQVAGEEAHGREVVHGDVKEPLDLGGVEVNGDDPVDPHPFQEARHQLGAHGLAAFGLLVLAGVAEVGDHGVDAGGGAPPGGVGQEEELHEVVVDGRRGGLDQVDIVPPDALQ